MQFRGFAADALEIKSFGYVFTTRWSEYLERAEKMNLDIREVVSEAGTSLAVPTQPLRIEAPGATPGGTGQPGPQSWARPSPGSCGPGRGTLTNAKKQRPPDGGLCVTGDAARAASQQ